MSTPHIVREKGEWFLSSRNGGQNENGNDREYVIDYRFAICYSLLNFLGCSKSERSELGDREEGKTVLQELKEYITSRVYWCKENLLEVIPFNCNGTPEMGFVVVDKADGVYPLVLYPDSRKRPQAYEEALDDVIRLYDNHVYPLLHGRHEAWNE